MNNDYLTIFKAVAQATESLAESVMQYNRDRKDKDGENTAQYMRDDFAKITDKLKENNKLSRSDYIKLLSGAMIVSNNIDDQIKIQQKVLHNYRSNLIPRLERIMNETKTDEEALILANELFK